jgi:hypothetical protein
MKVLIICMTLFVGSNSIAAPSCADLGVSSGSECTKNGQKGTMSCSGGVASCIVKTTTTK